MKSSLAASLALVGTLVLGSPAQAQTPMLASAYCCVGTGGGYCGATASGVRVGPAQMASDWRVLPRFSEWFVPNYGYARVTDTGGDIKGNRIDVFFTSCADAWAWGKRWVTISPFAQVSVDPPWRALVEEVTYLDEDAYVTRRTYDTNRGRLDTYEVHR